MGLMPAAQKAFEGRSLGNMDVLYSPSPNTTDWNSTTYCMSELT